MRAVERSEGGGGIVVGAGGEVGLDIGEDKVARGGGQRGEFELEFIP